MGAGGRMLAFVICFLSQLHLSGTYLHRPLNYLGYCSTSLGCVPEQRIWRCCTTNRYQHCAMIYPLLNLGIVGPFRLEENL